jgi:Tat protein translocase TatB subunit
MFGIGMPELAVILVVALVVLGPRRLPEMARALGKGLAEFRKVTGDVNKEIQSARDLIEKEAREHERLARELEREKRLARPRPEEAKASGGEPDGPPPPAPEPETPAPAPTIVPPDPTRSES